MLVGYMRVSKSDGSQTTDPQRDALREAGVDEVCGAPRDRCAKAVSPGCVACEVERARSTSQATQPGDTAFAHRSRGAPHTSSTPASRSASRCGSVVCDPSDFDTRIYPTSIRDPCHLYGRI